MATNEPAPGVPGRERELFRLGAAWGVATRGRPGLVLLTGPPGTGKTALTEALTGLARRTGGAVLRIPTDPDNRDAAERDRAGRNPADPPVPVRPEDDVPLLVVADDLAASGGAAAQRVHDLLDRARETGAALLAVVTVRTGEEEAVLAVLGEPSARIDLLPLPGRAGRAAVSG